MRFHIKVVICFLVVISLSIGLANPTLEDLKSAALDYVISSDHYSSSGGYAEKVLNSTINKETAWVVIEYRTDREGMLCHVITQLTMDPSTLQVIRAVYEEGCEVEGSGGSGNWTEPGSAPGAEPGNMEDEYRLRILYTINTTRAKIYENDAEDDLGDALDILQRAEELMELEDYEKALATAIEASELVSQYLNEGDGDEPVDIDEEYEVKISYTINATLTRIHENDAEDDLEEALDLLQEARELLENGEYGAALERTRVAESMVYDYLYGEGPTEVPAEDPVSGTPWLYGYIVIFEDEPDDDDWNRLLSKYNASYMGKAAEYTEESNAYWVRSLDVTPDDLLEMQGVRDVLALRGGPQPSDGTEVSQALAMPALIGVVIIFYRKNRDTR